MKHAHQTHFGRLETAVQFTPEQSGLVDKWDVLSALTDAADVFGLNHRTLGVLKALMTFLPERLIHAEPQSAIVFPSNRTLSKRLNGMPDSTLRRHLAALVSAGIVSRHDSANRKRFARRVAQNCKLAFGFDLSPLARLAKDIVAQARAAIERREQLAGLRAHVGQLRHMLIETDDQHPLAQDAARLLRRTPHHADLTDMCKRIEAVLNPVEPVKMSSTDAQSERHIQYENIILSNSEDDQVTRCNPNMTEPRVEAELHKDKETSPKFTQIIEVCEEYKSYFPEPTRNWHDLAHIADRLTPMMGIDSDVFKDAIKRMGLPSAVTAVLCILERLADIKNPGGYLRRLAQNAGAGGFDVGPMLAAIPKKSDLSADNLGYRYKTVC